jgi:hypothetical protein
VRVFVSHHHSSEENVFTARLVADLKAARADVWVDIEGITSDDFVIHRTAEGWAILIHGYSRGTFEDNDLRYNRQGPWHSDFDTLKIMRWQRNIEK